MNRPGYGARHPDIAELLGSLVPADVSPVTWFGAGLRLMVSAYPTDVVPGVLVGSARCVLWVGDRLVVCSTPDGPDITPGGRVEQGETYEETACREVYEEIGRSIEPGALAYLGFVHYRHRDPMRPGWTYPYPDFLQVIYTAALAGFEPLDDGAAGWTDLDDSGWVLGHCLATLDEVERLSITGAERVFLSASRTRFPCSARGSSRPRRQA